MKAVGDPRIIRNTQSSKHSHGLFGRAGGAGDPRIIENALISKHFRGLFGWVGPRAAPESLKVHRVMHFHGVGAAGCPGIIQNMKIYCAFPWFGWCG